MRRAAIGCVLLLTCHAAWGQARPPAAAPTPPPVAPAVTLPAPANTAREESLALVQVAGVPEQVDQIIAAMRTQITQALLRGSSKPVSDISADVDELVMPDIRSHRDDLIAQIAGLWAATFTAEEMKELRAFYGTPLGHKLVLSQPRLSGLVQAASRNWAEQTVRLALAGKSDALTQRGYRPATSPLPRQ